MAKKGTGQGLVSMQAAIAAVAPGQHSPSVRTVTSVDSETTFMHCRLSAVTVAAWQQSLSAKPTALPAALAGAQAQPCSTPAAAPAALLLLLLHSLPQSVSGPETARKDHVHVEKRVLDRFSRLS